MPRHRQEQYRNYLQHKDPEKYISSHGHTPLAAQSRIVYGTQSKHAISRRCSLSSRSWGLTVWNHGICRTEVARLTSNIVLQIFKRALGECDGYAEKDSFRNIRKTLVLELARH